MINKDTAQRLIRAGKAQCEGRTYDNNAITRLSPGSICSGRTIT